MHLGQSHEIFYSFLVKNNSPGFDGFRFFSFRLVIDYVDTGCDYADTDVIFRRLLIYFKRNNQPEKVLGDHLKNLKLGVT